MTQRSAGRWLGEFAVIFLSIVLALLADDWRERRSEREEGLDALELILADLRSEANGFSHFQERLGEQAESAADLMALLENGGSPGEITGAYVGVVLYYNFEVGSAAYPGLASSGGLRLIASDTVRAALTRYYDGAIPYMDGLRLAMERDADRVAAEGRRYFVRVPPRDEDGAFDPGGSWGFRVTAPPEEIRTDHDFLSAVGLAGASADFLASRIGTRFMDRNASARAYVEEYLTRMGRGSGSGSRSPQQP